MGLKKTSYPRAAVLYGIPAISIVTTAIRQNHSKVTIYGRRMYVKQHTYEAWQTGDTQHWMQGPISILSQQSIRISIITKLSIALWNGIPPRAVSRLSTRYLTVRRGRAWRRNIHSMTTSLVVVRLLEKWQFAKLLIWDEDIGVGKAGCCCVTEMVGSYLARPSPLKRHARTWGIKLELWKRLCWVPGVFNHNLYRNIS